MVLTLLLVLLLCLALNSKETLETWVYFHPTPQATGHIQAHLLYLETHVYSSLSLRISNCCLPGGSRLLLLTIV